MYRPTVYCQCIGSQFIASKTQETHSHGNTQCFFQNYISYFENSEDPDQLASDQMSSFEYSQIRKMIFNWALLSGGL